MNFIVLSSSRGTTFQAVLDALDNGSLASQCLGLIADREDRGCIEKARKAGVPVVIVSRHDGEDREAYDQRLHDAIGDFGEVDIIAALGWMFILSPWFVSQWRNKIINVHPALLPAHPGAHAITDALDAKDKESGMSIHIIDKGVDTGTVLLQKSCPIETDDTEETLKERIQELEKEWYPKVLQMIEDGELKLST